MVLRRTDRGFEADLIVVLRRTDYGFAAGCEAGLRPAVKVPLIFGLGPWFGLWPKHSGRARTKGLA